MRVALTGGIATGKSYVLDRFRGAGVPTIDADALVHEALTAGSPAIDPIKARFGGSVIAPDGSVDRKTLGQIVFPDPRARADLEAIVHPHVYRRIDQWFLGLGPTSVFAVADVPLLFETHHQVFFDRVIVASCPRTIQVERLIQRNGLTVAQAHERLAAQWPIEQKVGLADYIIDTSGTFEETDRQVDRVIAELNDGRALGTVL